MNSYRDDDLEPELRAMLGDHRLDVRPRGDAVSTVLAGVGRARRRRNTGYAAVTTFVVAGVVGGVLLTGGDTPQGFEPVVTPTTTSSPIPSSPPTTFSTPTTTPTMPPPPPETTPVGPPPGTLSPTGIDDLMLGMSVADAYAVGSIGMWDPATQTLTPYDGSAATDVCTPAGQAASYAMEGVVVWMDEANGVQEISISGEGQFTVDGLAVGMDLDEAVAMYPDIRKEEWGDPADGFFRYYVDDWLGSGSELEIRWNGNGPRVVEYVMLRAPGGHGCYE